MTTPRLLQSTDKQKQVVNRIKQDACFTADLKLIKATLETATIYTILTNNPNHPNSFIVYKKDFVMHADHSLLVQIERKLWINANGEITILDEKNQPTRDNINEYLFSAEALTRYQQFLKDKIFHPIYLKNTFKDALTLKHESVAINQEATFHHPRFFNKVCTVLTRKIEYILTINRSGEMYFLIHVNGQACKHTGFAGNFTIKPPTPDPLSIPEQFMRDYAVKNIFPFLEGPISAPKNRPAHQLMSAL